MRVKPNVSLHLVAHRGASYFIPEESLAAYSLAARHGVNYIECDIVSTKDGVLILRHSPNLSESTNIDDFIEFSHLRKTEILYDSNSNDAITGIFSWDLTYEEVKKIKCTHEKKYKNRSPDLNGIYDILTLDEFLKFSISGFDGHRPGLYIEIKYPTMHEKKGITNISDKLLDTLDRFGLNKKAKPVYIQSFEPSNLEYIRSKSELNLVQLLTRDDKNSFVYAVNDAEDDEKMKYVTCDMEYISKFANVVSPYKEDLIEYTNTTDNSLPTSSHFVSKAHELGLIVVPYTFRPESILPYFKNIYEEYDYFIRILKTDGVFTDDSQSIINYINHTDTRLYE
ncbi:glycerophosphodiester phosphodiesterase-related protein [Cryptosporidium ubiquitum]|uniref:glycerophosphodiester phosphodiesterase n=1 Tax=Cryptosporidium ubiquitum TaxID=857276 RepID=A0A1J4MDM6_9CRYT|nr:glycerophosphodiester phosphodiesterase-related protein [Cryptosporidium ubiquitum]OII72087.1 glycerophosphodiester phosphodiesterase-related protein [Cryptosporidium ubiquitum]